MSAKESIKPEETSFFNTFFNHTFYYLKKSLIFIILFVIFVVNLCALSLSIKCNKSEGLLFKISSGIYAFMFGILIYPIVIYDIEIFLLKIFNFIYSMINSKVYNDDIY